MKVVIGPSKPPRRQFQPRATPPGEEGCDLVPHGLGGHLPTTHDRGTRGMYISLPPPRREPPPLMDWEAAAPS